MIRTPPSQTHAQFASIEAAFLALLKADHEARAMALSLIVRHNATLPKGEGVALIVLGCHLMPNTITRAIEKTVADIQPGVVILTGGRTSEKWPEHVTEAGMMKRDLDASRSFNYAGRVVCETRAENTRQNFVNVAAEFGHELSGKSGIVVLTHEILTGRAMMTARKAFSDVALMDDQGFTDRVSVTGYKAKVPAYAPENPEVLAAALARIQVYSEAGHILLTPKERGIVEFLYTRTPEYASRKQDDRRYA